MNKFYRLGPRGKKYIFIRYCEHSNGYVFISEQANGSMTELESRDVEFLENNFSKGGDINLDLYLFEMEDTEISNNQNQPIPEVEKEFISYGSESNIHISEVGQIHRWQRRCTQ